MKKSIIFLINGLGIEKPGSYSISIDQVMPKLAKIRETSFFTTAITSSLEAKGAYQRFYLGDTYKTELDIIKNNIINSSLPNNPTYQAFTSSVAIPNSKLHIFVEPTNDRVVEEINNLVNTFSLEEQKKVYLHLLLPQLTTSDYSKLISIINYIKFHLNRHITVGFIIGKNSISDNPTKDNLDYMKKLLFMCSAERWAETEKKLEILREENVIPCQATGFCTTNECFIQNNDTIMFFNTRRENYDSILKGILDNAQECFKDEVKLYIYSLIKLYSNYQIPSFVDNIDYENSLANILLRNSKKALIIAKPENMELINFYANGLNSINNPVISFMTQTENLYQKDQVQKLIEETPYDLFIFDYEMDTSKDINHLKSELSKLDIIIGNLAEISENKHSLFITSLYGIKKTLPVAEYNGEEVEINYEMQIPIFFYDYTYPHGKYHLAPGETNDILSSAIKCVAPDPTLYTLVKEKGLINNLLKAFKN